MASRLSPWGIYRNLCVRSRPLLRTAERQGRVAFPVARRGLADDTTTIQPDRESSASSTPPPDLGESSSSTSPPDLGEESLSTPPPSYQPYKKELWADNFLNAEALARLEQAAAGEDALDGAGLKFGMPPVPGKDDRLQNRYPTIIHQFTRLLMRDGKLSKAERHVAIMLNILRTTAAPVINPQRPLLLGAPPPAQLPLNPIVYLTMAIDSVAPLFRIRALKGMAGGGFSLEIPEPLTGRQRRRQAILWILEVASKKKSRGSGRTQFAHRLAEEIVAVVEGRSPVWDKRQIVHKLATASRANLNSPKLKSKSR